MQNTHGWRAGSRTRILKIGAASVLMALICLPFFGIQYARWELQSAAERAALAGLKSLRQSSVGKPSQSPGQRLYAAVDGSRLGGAKATVVASVSPMYVAVELSDQSSWFARIGGGLKASAKAGYAPPTTDAEAAANLDPPRLALMR